jgi:hypothetical protein
MFPQRLMARAQAANGGMSLEILLPWSPRAAAVERVHRGLGFASPSGGQGHITWSSSWAF